MNLIFLLLSINVFALVRGLCVMKQDCDIKSPDCKPGPANFTQPTILKGMNVICPEYNNQLACCSNNQNILMKNNFDALDSLFGTKYGGCDICAINLKRLWCKFTCDPEQHTFRNLFFYF